MFFCAIQFQPSVRFTTMLCCGYSEVSSPQNGHKKGTNNLLLFFSVGLMYACRQHTHTPTHTHTRRIKRLAASSRNVKPQKFVRTRCLYLLFELVFSALVVAVCLHMGDTAAAAVSVDKGCVARVTNKLIVLYAIYRRAGLCIVHLDVPLPALSSGNHR